MSRTIRWFVLFACLISSNIVVADSKPKDPNEKPDIVYRNPMITVPRMGKAPSIDGTIDKAEWSLAAQPAPMVQWRSEGAGLLPDDYADSVAYRVGVSHITLTKGGKEHKFSPNITFMYMLLFNGSLRMINAHVNPAAWHVDPASPNTNIYNYVKGPFNPYFIKSGMGMIAAPMALFWQLQDDMNLKEATFVPFWRNEPYLKLSAEPLRCSFHRMLPRAHGITWRCLMMDVGDGLSSMTSECQTRTSAATLPTHYEKQQPCFSAQTCAT